MILNAVNLQKVQNSYNFFLQSNVSKLRAFAGSHIKSLLVKI